MTVDAERLAFLECTANRVRQLVVSAINKAGAGHVGGPLSAAEVFVALYFEVLRIDPQRPRWEDRDRFILSKGHASAGLYAVMALRGFLPVEELDTFDQINSRLQGHPDMNALPGLDMSTGSLGQGLSPGLGMALAARAKGRDFHTWVMLGDGELQEGQVWEAAFVASRYRVDNLTAIVDNNKLQLWGWTKQPACEPREVVEPMPNIRAKFEAFGWAVLEIDGHDIRAILRACEQAKGIKGKPTVIISNTIKGKGVSFMENQCVWHSKAPNAEETRIALSELQAAQPEGTP